MYSKRIDDFKIDLDLLKNDVNEVIEKAKLEGHHELQISLKHRPGFNSYADGIGSIYDREKKIAIYDEKDFSELRTDLPQYLNKVIKDVKMHIPEKLGRIRIMQMKPQSLYTFHHDLDVRYHFAIETNEDCKFVWPHHVSNEIAITKHIPADGYLWWINTKAKHTFINASKKWRIHLVFCTWE